MPDPVRTFRHFRDVPDSLWRWPNFSPAEIACRGTGQLKLHPEALDKLQALRDRLGKPLIVRSAYRSPSTTARRRGAALEAHGRHGLRHRHGEPRPGGLRGGGARGGVPRLRLLPALGLHAYRSRARAGLGRAVPGARGALCRRDPPARERRWPRAGR
jgi:hypothetical protein